jgi:6-phosphogluconolactonase
MGGSVVNRTVEVRPTADALATDVAQALADRIAVAQQERGVAHVVLTGGGIGTAVMAALAPLPVDWSALHLWWGDERFLPDGDPDRNVTQAAAVLLDRVPLVPGHVHAMPADTGQGVEQAALDYADALARSSADGSLPRFDVLLLGVGPEGHVASIFPESPAAKTGDAIVAVHASPKPPPTRITMTFPTIRSADDVWLVAAGQEKAAAIAQAMDPTTNPVDVPAAGAVGTRACVAWIDSAAASALRPT